ncbi:ATP synthase I chain [Caminicella sporogenes DSM 14501]|uniref:ATP synthase I chain n=1 Tax=Caminicella sporogenes DSM 14501 TaxID=1121266 RepID=A0A1M6PTM4_9FIRM|nr:ATP synthase subunit I [Caminicella sporogenes]RKD21982.1 hypothetical protein BET04_06945 [Caminicella sporogenes]SHK11261.1 ATP synthase I chain [Caminicella sporogenes DSM 14501]
MGATRDLQIRTIKLVFIIDLILIVLSFLIFDKSMPWILGLIFGSAISSLNFIELGKTLERAVTMPPSRAQAYAASKYFVRYIITGVVIYVSLKADYINVLGTIIGLFLVKFVIISTNLFNDKQYFKNILKRKEAD